MINGVVHNSFMANMLSNIEEFENYSYCDKHSHVIQSDKAVDVFSDWAQTTVARGTFLTVVCYSQPAQITT